LPGLCNALKIYVALLFRLLVRWSQLVFETTIAFFSKILFCFEPFHSYAFA